MLCPSRPSRLPRDLRRAHTSASSTSSGVNIQMGNLLNLCGTLGSKAQRSQPTVVAHSWHKRPGPAETRLAHLGGSTGSQCPWRLALRVASRRELSSVNARGMRFEASVGGSNPSGPIVLNPSLLRPLPRAPRPPESSGLRDHEHDGHDGERDAADGEQRDGAEPQRTWPPVRSACSNSRWRCAPTINSPTARDA